MIIFYHANEMKKHWLATMMLGILYVIAGLFALSFAGLTTLVSVSTLGIILAIAGVGEIIFAFKTKQEGHLWYHLLMGILGLVIGGFIFARPFENAMVLTLLFSIYMMVAGLTRFFAGLLEKFPGSGFVAFSGLLSTLLGFLVLMQWPVSGLWMIGVFVGCDVIVFGLSMIRLAMFGRKLAHGQVVTQQANPAAI